MRESNDMVNRETLIKDMVERLVQEGIEEEDLDALKAFAQSQPYETLRKDSLLFWSMRI